MTVPRTRHWQLAPFKSGCEVVSGVADIDLCILNILGTRKSTDVTRPEADYIDAATVSIPFNSVIADADLPAITDKQTFIVTGERNADGYFTVSQNVTAVEDHRGETVYSTTDGSAVEIKEIGRLPENTTALPRPDKYHEWENGQWVEVKNAAALRLADKRAAMPDLTRVQLFKALYLSKKITESDIQAVIDKIADKDTRTIAQIEFQTNAFERSNAVLIQAAHALNISDEEIDRMWQTATDLK